MINPQIFPADEATFWPFLTWADFASWPAKGGTLVVVPVVGMADWGLGQPLDAEELLLARVLRDASRQRGDLPLLVTPPLRFVVGPASRCAFPVAPPVACALIDEVVLSVRAAGFSRVVLLNSSPWNEELCDAVARDLRITHGLQMFCVNMAALGLDLHPERSRHRGELQAAVTALTGTAPEAGLELPEAASRDAGPMLQAAAGRLAQLLREIHGRPPLPDQGRLGPVTLR